MTLVKIAVLGKTTFERSHALMKIGNTDILSYMAKSEEDLLVRETAE